MRKDNGQKLAVGWYLIKESNWTALAECCRLNSVYKFKGVLASINIRLDITLVVGAAQKNILFYVSSI